jgi:MFS family permease
MKDTHDDHTQHDEKPAGQPVIGEQTIWWACAGLLIGGAIGLLLGLSLGYGKFNLPGLAPLVVAGVGVPALVFTSLFAAAFGLTGALLATRSESTAASGSRHEAKPHKQSQHEPALIQQLPVYGAIGLALFMAFTLFVIALRAYGRGTPSDQSNRITWNQKNVARVGAAHDAETAGFILQTTYPATRAENRPATIITVADDWRVALAATSLIAAPSNAALIIYSPPGVDANTDREVGRLTTLTAPSPSARPTAESQPVSSPSPGLSSGRPATLAIGVFSESEESIPPGDPATIAAAIDERHARAEGGVGPNVIVVGSESDYRWALPAGAYAAKTGTPILFVSKDSVPQPTASALQTRGGAAHIFVLGPDSAVSGSVFDQLKQFGTVERIAGDDYVENAVRFAEFRDPGVDFGWGRSGRGPRRWAVTNTILVNGDRWQDGVLAAHLARRGKTGALLFTERERIPPAVDNYLWRQRPVFANTPAEGPFNHIWIVGSFDRISYGAQAWADYSQEIEQYMTLGDSAVSGYEALAVVWLMFCFASAVWIVYHSRKRLPEVMPVMKAAWAILALMLGPLAVWLYVLNYHRREKRQHEGMTMWQRPLWLQTISATVMMFAFDMMLMCLAVFLVAYFGFPIVRFNGPFYWLGSSMFLMMVLMYLIALVVMMFVFHTPMTMHERKIKSYRKAFMAGLPIMIATMTVESVGMMPTMWWQQMLFLPAMQMPTNDDLTMWSTLLFSVFVGFVVVLPFNYWMVRRGKKMGTM